MLMGETTRLTHTQMQGLGVPVGFNPALFLLDLFVCIPFLKFYIW